MEEARICVTHAFLGHENTYQCYYDEEENKVVNSIVSSEYDDYDLLIQLADEMSLVKGWCLLETRLAKKMLAVGLNQRDWDDFCYLHKIKKYFDERAAEDIYKQVLLNEKKVIFE
jgi:hypothetical protein